MSKCATAWLFGPQGECYDRWLSEDGFLPGRRGMSDVPVHTTHYPLGDNSKGMVVPGQWTYGRLILHKVKKNPGILTCVDNYSREAELELVSGPEYSFEGFYAGGQPKLRIDPTYKDPGVPPHRQRLPVTSVKLTAALGTLAPNFPSAPPQDGAGALRSGAKSPRTPSGPSPKASGKDTSRGRVPSAQKRKPSSPPKSGKKQRSPKRARVDGKQKLLDASPTGMLETRDPVRQILPDFSRPLSQPEQPESQEEMVIDLTSPAPAEKKKTKKQMAKKSSRAANLHREVSDSSRQPLSTQGEKKPAPAREGEQPEQIPSGSSRNPDGDGSDNSPPAPISPVVEPDLFTTRQTRSSTAARPEPKGEKEKPVPKKSKGKGSSTATELQHSRHHLIQQRGQLKAALLPPTLRSPTDPTEIQTVELDSSYSSMDKSGDTSIVIMNSSDEHASGSGSGPIGSQPINVTYLPAPSQPPRAATRTPAPHREGPRINHTPGLSPTPNIPRDSVIRAGRIPYVPSDRNVDSPPSDQDENVNPAGSQGGDRGRGTQGGAGGASQ